MLGVDFFRDPSALVASPPPPAQRLRTGGLVEKDSVVRGEGTTVTFRVTDLKASIPVTFTGVLPLWAAFVLSTLSITLCYLPSHEAQHSIIATEGSRLRWLCRWPGS